AGFLQYTYGGEGADAFPEDELDSTFFGGINLSVPIWSSGARRGAYREAISDQEIALLQYKQRKEELVAELSTVVEEYRAAIDIYKANKKTLQLADESYRIALSSFKAGSASQSQLNDAELQLTSTKRRTLESLFSVNLLLARIEKLIAKDIQ
ncbi:MAG: hypothetical protein GF384_08005, partial [Elusimicrobia bacterium]|nr:hypothetical protein [Elusimicrobiota bacterium]MBD3412578.1 hypothetical protein [Elusimicrobiota bacterium]